MFVARALPRTSVPKSLRSGSAIKPSHVLGNTTSVATRHHARWNSGNAGSTGSSSTSSTTSTPVIVAGAVLSGLVGYYLAHLTSAPPQVAAAHTRPVKFNEQYGSPKDFENAVKEIRVALPADGAATTDPEVLKKHGMSFGSLRDSFPPTVVVYPQSTEDVVKIVNISRKYRMPVVAYSGATSLENHLKTPPVGGICVDMSKMNRVLEIHEEDSDIVCQPGAGWVEINEMLKKKGIPLFVPLDPAPRATIGGMIGCGCSGTNAVRYGTAKGEWFLNVTVVLPSGEVMKTRRRSRKCAAGFDTTKLFIGAEGTLGIITEVTVRLAPVLPTRVAIAQFPDVQKATQAAVEILNHGVGLQCLELCDSVFMRATNAYGKSKRKYPERDSIYFKLQGPTPAAMEETARVVRTVSEKYGATGFEYAETEEEAEELWLDRKNGFYSALALVPGARAIGTDVCVPVSRLPELVSETKKDLEAVGLTAPIVGHVGDGNFHAMLLYRTEDEGKIAHEVVDRLVRRAIALDGTCTGEHGVGIGKRKYLYEELGENTVEFMKMLKKTIDPLNLFNPGKLYPEELQTSQKEKR